MKTLRESRAETCMDEQDGIALFSAAQRLVVQKISANRLKGHRQAATNSSTLGQVHTRWRSP